MRQPPSPHARLGGYALKLFGKELRGVRLDDFPEIGAPRAIRNGIRRRLHQFLEFEPSHRRSQVERLRSGDTAQRPGRLAFQSRLRRKARRANRRRPGRPPRASLRARAMARAPRQPRQPLPSSTLRIAPQFWRADSGQAVPRFRTPKLGQPRFQSARRPRRRQLKSWERVARAMLLPTAPTSRMRARSENRQPRPRAARRTGRELTACLAAYRHRRSRADRHAPAKHNAKARLPRRPNLKPPDDCRRRLPQPPNIAVALCGDPRGRPRSEAPKPEAEALRVWLLA